MNIKNMFSLFLLSILFTTTNCTKDYLEQESDNRINLNSLEKAAETLVYAYPRYSYAFTEWMTDNITYIADLDDVNWVRDLYEWKENISSIDEDSPTGYWETAYYAIAQTNLVLSAIENIETDNTAYKNAIKGEALLCRAYAHFMLVNLFAKHYDPKTASTDPGIPYVKKLENKLLTEYKRNTVKQVYDTVWKDLSEGMKLVSKKYYKNSGKFHFSKQSALAFASRFYLWKKEYKNAEKYATQLLSEGESKFVRNYQKDVLTPQSRNDVGINFNNPGVFSNLMLGKHIVVFSGSWIDGLSYSTSVNLFRSIFLLHGKRPSFLLDYRRSTAFGVDFVVLAKLRRQFQTTNPVTGVGNRYDTEVLFRGEEVLLNRAEARLLKAEPNITGAEADLNYILNDRYYDVGGEKLKPGEALKEIKKAYTADFKSEKDALLQLIIDQRQVEFFVEGLRWFDIKRFGLSVTHERLGAVYTLTANDPRKILQIPQSAIKLGVKPSPRPQKNASVRFTVPNKLLKK